ncbi:dexh-box atp-dependent rna helicase dexh5 [Quercus suber]|uniref:Dexh-box atp-dependent rna helicase dexh5 n=1 Tax=Quercus suber TaxID=58331 RepID=A0AAW0LMS8_QUESU
MEKIHQRRSLQLRDQQRAWQESPEGRKMLEFRRSLPAYKEKNTLLTAVSRNQTKQLKNNQFRATVEFNGMQIMGQPCNNKKSAEKDAAAEALQWLMGGNQAGHEHLNHMSMLLKKSKKDHN